MSAVSATEERAIDTPGVAVIRERAGRWAVFSGYGRFRWGHARTCRDAERFAEAVRTGQAFRDGAAGEPMVWTPPAAR